MLFTLLPQEVVLQVLECLEPSESKSLIILLKSYLPNANAQRAINLLYARLYLGLTFLGAGRQAPKQHSVSVTPSEYLELCSDSQVLANIPNHLKMVFVRDARDYINFQQNLADLRDILLSEWAVKYLSKVQILTLEIDGQCITTETPTLMPALVLSTLVELTRHSSANFQSISLNSTDIGDLLPHKWGKVFGAFTGLQELSLEDNKLRLDLLVGHEPLMEKYFKWPPHLRVLSLSKNLLCHFRANAVRKLPETLEVLDLSYNLLECVGGPYDESFKLAAELPRLKVLNLAHNRHLFVVDVNIFEGVEEVEVDVRGCNVSDGQLEALLHTNGIRLRADMR